MARVKKVKPKRDLARKAKTKARADVQALDEEQILDTIVGAILDRVTDDYRLRNLYDLSSQLSEVSGKLDEVGSLLERTTEIRTALSHIMLKLPGGGNG